MRALLRRAGVFVVAAAAGACAPDPPPFRPVADVKQLMQAVIDPAADEIWDSTGWIVTLDGVEERKPENDEQWAAARNRAVAIAEAGNLLMMAPRAKDGGEWMLRSQELVDAGTAAWRAADAKDVQRLFDAGGVLYESCTNCHEKYIQEIAQ